MPAGTYHLVLDAFIIRPVDTTFDLIWRRGTTDTTLFTFTEHYEPLGGASFDAQMFEYDQTGAAIDFQDGDQLVFRYSANAASDPAVYEPNGEGSRGGSGARHPNITLPRPASTAD